MPGCHNFRRNIDARLSAVWRQDLDDRISQFQDLRDRLTGCIGCGCLSLGDCQLANPDDMLGAGGSGPRRLSGQPGHGQGRGEQDDGP
jgi:MerR family transcriptional regulator, redox-sensitive transcriptional activator SoxR